MIWILAIGFQQKDAPTAGFGAGTGDLVGIDI